MNVLDLFSGIGGFSLGLERAGMKTVAFCEIEEFPRQVLKKHWPDVPIYEDVRELNKEVLSTDGIQSIDVICGGFPCQDISSAGLQKGLAGVRSGLYRQMLRVISECLPRYAIFENVANFLIGNKGRWFAQFLYDLAAIGYDAEWHYIPATSVGANHRRGRVWIIAYPKGNSKQSSIFQGAQRKELFRGQFRGSAYTPVPGTHWEKGVPEFAQLDDGISGWVGAASGYGNSVVPQIPEIIGRAIMAIENPPHHPRKQGD